MNIFINGVLKTFRNELNINKSVKMNYHRIVKNIVKICLDQGYNLGIHLS